MGKRKNKKSNNNIENKNNYTTDKEYFEYKDRKFVIATKGDKKTVLFLLNKEDMERLKKSKINPYFDFKEQNKKILNEYLNDKDFCTIVKLKCFGFGEDGNMYGYAVDTNSCCIYNCICMINNFIY